jgi:CDP-glycerol glycerophosphotransferase
MQINTLKRKVKNSTRNLLKLLFKPLNIVLVFIDWVIPKRNDYWIFPTYFIGQGNFCDSTLAIYEKVKFENHIKKIILTKSTKVDVQGDNVIVIPMNSIRAVWYIFRSNIIFVQHSIWLDLSNSKYQINYPFSRHIINLWHGIAIKDISHPNTGIINKRSILEMPNYNVIASSTQDAINMSKAFHVTPKENFWVTGLPRNDFLKMNEGDLPASYQRELTVLKKLKGDKNLILYAPTYREEQSGGSQYEFNQQELITLNEYLSDTNSILGLRYHIYRKPSTYTNLLAFDNIVEIPEEVVSDVRLIIRESYLVITDYSSLYVDALYIDKPCLSFAYDYEHYMLNQRGCFYDFEEIFPGKICKSFQEMMNELVGAMNYKNKAADIKNTLFEYNDANNSQRIVDNVMKYLK